MAFRRKRTPRLFETPRSRPTNSIVAASQRMIPDAYGNLRIPKSAWQAEAWRQLELSPELSFYVSWKSNSYSRCRLIVADVAPNGQILGETKNERAIAIGAGFAGNPGRAAQIMHSFGAHLSVPGDCYVVAHVDAKGAFERWCVYSTEEIGLAGQGQFTINTGDGYPLTYNVNETLLIRVYRQDPRRSYEATSPTRAVLPVLRESEQLSKYEFAVMDSRLATAGILGVPSGLEFPSPGDDIQPGESPLMAYLAQVFLASIKDRSSAAAVVPITLQGPKEELDGIRWITPPNAELTTVVADLRDKATRRMAIGLDIPPEVLLGMGNANDWSAATLEEASVKLYIEPDMMIICGALTEGYLSPALELEGLDPAKFAYWYDPAELILRPNRALDAKDAFDRGVIGQAALRRELGFPETDALDGDEKCLRGLLEVLKASPQAGDMLAKALIRVLGLESCGVTPEDLIPVAPDPAGGTPPKTPALPEQLPVDGANPPNPGHDGNQGV